MTVKLSSWYDELLVNVPGAPRAALELSLHRTLADFLRRSGAYAKEIPGIALKAGKATYTIPQQPEGPILFTYGVYYDGRPLSPLMMEQVLTRMPVSNSTPTAYRRYLEDANRITVMPTPGADLPLPLVPYVAFGYSKSCQDNLPELFGTHWYEVILNGAISRLCSMPGKPYSDPTLATVHAKLFRSGVALAREQARKTFVRMETPFRFPKWA